MGCILRKRNRSVELHNGWARNTSRLLQTRRRAQIPFRNGMLLQTTFLNIFVVMQSSSRDEIIKHHFVYRPVCRYCSFFHTLPPYMTWSPKKRWMKKRVLCFSFIYCIPVSAVLTKQTTSIISFFSPWSSRYFNFTRPPIHILFPNNHPNSFDPDLLHHQKQDHHGTSQPITQRYSLPLPSHFSPTRGNGAWSPRLNPDLVSRKRIPTAESPSSSRLHYLDSGDF
jgi:hypothetical protein